jgi:hypothetical protein
VLNRIFEPERGALQEAGENFIFKNFITCTVQSTVMASKSPRMKYAGIITRTRGIKNVLSVCPENLKRRDQLGVLGIDERIILKCISEF